ncbi:hypothetical protein RDI58_026768 [Solanum bulbocastanum]|uniref:NAC domain-containing protein n=1 Tax=Solanum bulbocastanum TaxID=147425 RepID=A0AAN8Y1R8_SOLBU
MEVEPLGYRFHPTASEGLQYLIRFMAKKEMNDDGLITTNLDVYSEEEPWEIYGQGVPSGGPEDDDSHSDRYFFTKKNKGEIGNKKARNNQFPTNCRIHHHELSLDARRRCIMFINLDIGS